MPRKRKRKVGSTYITIRKINGRRRRVKVTKLSKGRERIKILSKRR
jgi:hypothetical protein